MSEKDIEIWNECVAELSPEGQQEADVVLRNFTKKLKAHTDYWNMKKRKKARPKHPRPHYDRGLGRAGAKELIIALIKGGHL